MSETSKRSQGTTPSPQEGSKHAPAPSKGKGSHRRSGRSVFQYITILFAAAFVLLLMAYMMQQRQNEAQIDDLQETSNSALESLQNIIAERDQLRKANEELTDQLEDTTQAANNSAAEADRLERSVQAMDWFWRIQRQFSRGYTYAARELAEQFDASGLVDDLPDTSYAEPDGPSPKQQYEELHNLLF